MVFRIHIEAFINFKSLFTLSAFSVLKRASAHSGDLFYFHGLIQTLGAAERGTFQPSKLWAM